MTNYGPGSPGTLDYAATIATSVPPSAPVQAGTQLVLEVEFTDGLTGAAVDPASVTLGCAPHGITPTILTYEAGSGPITRTAAGCYQATIDTSVNTGTLVAWDATWVGSGAHAAAVATSFLVVGVGGTVPPAPGVEYAISVNGQSGVVVLTAAEVGADPAGAALAEQDRAEGIEAANAAAITGEIARAEGIEGGLTTALAAEVANRVAAITPLATSASVTAGLAGKASLVGGLVPRSQLPNISGSLYQAVANQAAMLALTAPDPDTALTVVRADTPGELWVLNPGLTASVLANWLPIPFDPTGAASAAQAAAQAYATSAIASQHAADLGDFTALQTVAAVATASGVLLPNQHNPVDATTGNRTMTLPTGQPGGTRLSVERVDGVPANSLSVTGSIRGVPATTITLLAPSATPAHESVEFLADSSGSWWPIAGHKTKTWLDATYDATGAATTAVAGEVTARNSAIATQHAADTAAFASFPTAVPKALQLLQANNAVNPPTLQWTTSSTEVARSLGWIVVTDPQWAGGADPSGLTDSTAAINAAVAAAASSTNIRTLYFPPGAGGTGSYKYVGVLPITVRGLAFVGSRLGRPTQTGGARINFYGPSSTGATGTNLTMSCGIQMGTDDGQAWSNSDYSGVQGFTLQDISLAAVDGGAGTVALTNGTGSYVKGAFGVRDWKGGDVRLIRSTFENFQYGFWGVNSDINRWEDTQAFYCRVGTYLGPRSDQLQWLGSYHFGCDRDIELDGVRVAAIHNYVTDSSGSSGTGICDQSSAAESTTIKSTAPVVVHSHGGTAADAVAFTSPWLEYDKNLAQIDAFFEVGPSDADTQTGDVTISEPYYVTTRSTDSPEHHVRSLVRLGNAQSVAVIRPHGVSGSPNTDQTVEYIGATSPSFYGEASGAFWQYFPRFLNSGTGTPFPSWKRSGGGSNSSVSLGTSGVQLHSQMIIQKSDTPSGSGQAPLTVYRDNSVICVQVNNSGNFNVRVGFILTGRGLNGATLNGWGSYTVTWVPGTIAAGAIATIDVACAGAIGGDPIVCGLSSLAVAGMILTGTVSSGSTVRVTLFNGTGASQTIPSGTLRVDVLGH